MIRRIIVTKTNFEDCEFIVPVIHQPLLKIKILNQPKINTDWVLVTSPNAIYNFGNYKIIAPKSCIDKLNRKPEIVLESMKNEFIQDLIKDLTKSESVTYLSGEITSLKLEKNKNLFREVVYLSEFNKLEFKPEETDLVVFWSGLAVKSAYNLGWRLKNIVSCSKSATLELKEKPLLVEKYKLNEILDEIKNICIFS